MGSNESSESNDEKSGDSGDLATDMKDDKSKKVDPDVVTVDGFENLYIWTQTPLPEPRTRRWRRLKHHPLTPPPSSGQTSSSCSSTQPIGVNTRREEGFSDDEDDNPKPTFMERVHRKVPTKLNILFLILLRTLSSFVTFDCQLTTSVRGHAGEQLELSEFFCTIDPSLLSCDNHGLMTSYAPSVSPE